MGKGAERTMVSARIWGRPPTRAEHSCGIRQMLIHTKSHPKQLTMVLLLTPKPLSPQYQIVPSLTPFPPQDGHCAPSCHTKPPPSQQSVPHLSPAHSTHDTFTHTSPLPPGCPCLSLSHLTKGPMARPTPQPQLSPPAYSCPS